MLPVYMSAYPWDVVDSEAVDWLDRLQGEIGISGLTVPVAVPSMITLRAEPCSPRVFRTRGGVFFHPSATRYDNTRCKPIVSSWIKSRDPFTKIASVCCDRGLSLRAVVSATNTGRLAQRYPDLACKNVFGDVSQDSVCLSNGDVQAFVYDVIADLSSTYSLSTVLLEHVGCQWAEASRGDWIAPPALGLSARKLLSLCFCESCYQQAALADLDLSPVREFVANLLNRALQKSQINDTDVAHAMADSALLLAYYRWIQNSYVAVLTNARQSCQGELGLYAGKDIDLTATIAHSADLDLLITDPQAANRLSCHTAPCDFAAHNIRYETKLSTQAPEWGGTDWVNAFQSAVEQGYTGVEVGPLGQLCDDAIAPLKQAIRFARRSHAR